MVMERRGRNYPDFAEGKKIANVSEFPPGLYLINPRWFFCEITLRTHFLHIENLSFGALHHIMHCTTIINDVFVRAVLLDVT